MANTNITSGTSFAQIFFSIFGKKSYNPSLPAPICASRQDPPSLKPPDSIGLMEALCTPIINRPTKLKPDSATACLLYEALFIEIQISLTLLGASTADAEKPVYHTRFSP